MPKLETLDLSDNPIEDAGIKLVDLHVLSTIEK